MVCPRISLERMHWPLGRPVPDGGRGVVKGEGLAAIAAVDAAAAMAARAMVASLIRRAPWSRPWIRIRAATLPVFAFDAGGRPATRLPCGYPRGAARKRVRGG